MLFFYNSNVTALTGTYSLNRVYLNTLSSLEISSLIEDSEIPEYSFELVTDSLFSTEMIQNAIYNKLKNSGSLILFKILETDDITITIPNGHEKDYNVLYLFPEYKEKATGSTYPAYVKYLEMIREDVFSGVISDIQKLDNRQFDPKVMGISYQDFTYFFKLRKILTAYGEYSDGRMSVGSISTYYPQSVISVIRLINYIYTNLDTTTGELSIRDSITDKIAILKEKFPRSYSNIVLNDVSVVDEKATIDVSIYFNIQEIDVRRIQLSLDLR